MGIRYLTQPLCGNLISDQHNIWRLYRYVSSCVESVFLIVALSFWEKNTNLNQFQSISSDSDDEEEEAKAQAKKEAAKKEINKT